jgi:hypothetical protein
MKFEQKPMVGWFDVKQLASTGLKTALSIVFGNYADKREIQAFTDQDIFDYSNNPELWVDYISDLGDGFNSTYTLAHLIAQESITAGNHTMRRGNLLIMGGDEVYPTPESKEYKNRLQGPYNAAFPWIDEKIEPKESKPKLFAIPGNHDWYDGLTNFMKLFCQGRALGNWLTQQKRSYFAIKLPHRHWLIGIDIQLNSDIDEPQKTYFKEKVAAHFQPGDKVILCTAEPSWALAALSGDFESDNRLKYFIDQILIGKNDGYHGGKTKDLHIVAMLAGDLHHYSRYESVISNNSKITQLITAGGGGAFMHPTHNLEKAFRFENGFGATLKGVFPSGKNSRQLAWKNLAFPWLNKGMSLFLGIIYLFIDWSMQSASLSTGADSLMQKLSKIQFSIGNAQEVLAIILDSLRYSPFAVLLNLLLFGGIIFFTDTSSKNGKWNYSFGFLHGLVHIKCLYGCLWGFSILNLQWLHLEPGSWTNTGLFIVEMLLIGSAVAGFVFGLYLIASTLILKNHPTEAYSSFRYEDYKNFLRLHITKEKLSIYPIGIKTVVKNWRNTGTPDNPAFVGDPIRFELIETPIEIPTKS